MRENGLYAVSPLAIYNKFAKILESCANPARSEQRHFPTHRAETAVGIRWVKAVPSWTIPSEWEIAQVQIE